MTRHVHHVAAPELPILDPKLARHILYPLTPELGPLYDRTTL